MFKSMIPNSFIKQLLRSGNTLSLGRSDGLSLQSKKDNHEGLGKVRNKSKVHGRSYPFTNCDHSESDPS